MNLVSIPNFASTLPRISVASLAWIPKDSRPGRRLLPMSSFFTSVSGSAGASDAWCKAFPPREVRKQQFVNSANRLHSRRFWRVFNWNPSQRWFSSLYETCYGGFAFGGQKYSLVQFICRSFRKNPMLPAQIYSLHNSLILLLCLTAKAQIHHMMYCWILLNGLYNFLVNRLEEFCFSSLISCWGWSFASLSLPTN